jgi:glycosyltransferase involved in cell wall biosynthesis
MLIPSCRAASPGPGVFVFGKKFLDGVVTYARHWPGRVEVLTEIVPEATEPDARAVSAKELPFAVTPIKDSGSELTDALRRAAVISAALIPEKVSLAEVCREIGVPVVYVSEYSILTRKQIIQVETKNPLLRLRRGLWTTQLEARYLRSLRLAAGVQCNGTPTYEAYRSVNQRPLLFFDSRVDESMIVKEEVLETRLRTLLEHRPLRLVFSGRLTGIKGVDDLPRVAQELRRMGVPFTLDIYGTGELASSLRTQIARLGLADAVQLHGFIDFETALVPRISNSADLFVCCHRQGDPSCTYLETLSCGTPIAGYANEAFCGIRALSSAGWETPLDDPRALAEVIATLNHKRAELAEASRAARRFAVLHPFNETFRRRVEHLVECQESSPRVRAGSSL